MSTCPSRAKIFDKLARADRALSITRSGIKAGPIFHASSAVGTGKNIFTSDSRLSAISRDGSRVEINYNNYAAENIPGFLEWMDANGISDYHLDGPHIIFANLTDADLFFLTFTGIKGNRFMQMTTRRDLGWREASDEINKAKEYAKRIGHPVFTHTEQGMARIKT